jgi:hypothetical protein
VGVAIAPLRVLGLPPSNAWSGQQWRDYAQSFLKVLQLIRIHLLGRKLFFVGAPRMGSGLIWYPIQFRKYLLVGARQDWGWG